LIASVRSTVGVSLIADSVAAAIGATNQPVRIVDTGGEAEPFPGYTVVRGRGVLDDAQTVLSSAAADAVLLVVQSGVTVRADLEAARLQIAAEGGSLVGAVLQP
jgi:hypothetical protein